MAAQAVYLPALPEDDPPRWPGAICAAVVLVGSVAAWGVVLGVILTAAAVFHGVTP